MKLSELADTAGKFSRFVAHAIDERVDFLKEVEEVYFKIKKAATFEVKKIKSYWYDAYLAPEYQSFENEFGDLLDGYDAARMKTLVGAHTIDPMHWSEHGTIGRGAAAAARETLEKNSRQATPEELLKQEARLGGWWKAQNAPEAERQKKVGSVDEALRAAMDQLRQEESKK